MERNAWLFLFPSAARHPKAQNKHIYTLHRLGYDSLSSPYSFLRSHQKPNNLVSGSMNWTQ